MVATLQAIVLLISLLPSNCIAVVFYLIATLFYICSVRPQVPQAAAPASYGDQCPPLRNHEHETATSDAHLHHSKTSRALQEPIFVPREPGINVSAYRSLVYLQSRNHRLHVTEVNLEQSL